MDLSSDRTCEDTQQPLSLDGLAAPLDLARKLGQEQLAPIVQVVVNGQEPAAPVVVELDVTTACDLACPECISQNVLHQGGFTNDRAAALADEIADAGVRAVILIGGGEPLLHRAVDTVMLRLATAGVAVGVTTNGTQIHRHLQTLADHAAWTRVSVDAGTAATYAVFRPSRGGNSPAFDRVIANMSALAKEKRGRLGYSYLLIARRDSAGRVVSHNFGEIALATRIAREIGCDYIEIKPEFDSRHHLIQQPMHLRQLLVEQFSAAQELQRSDFLVIAPAHLARVANREELDQPKTYRRCAVADLRTLITPSGAYVCPYHRGNDLARYGSPQDQSFSSLWESSARQQALMRIDPSVSCRFNCIRHESNEALLTGLVATDAPSEYDPFI